MLECSFLLQEGVWPSEPRFTAVPEGGIFGSLTLSGGRALSEVSGVRGFEHVRGGGMPGTPWEGKPGLDRTGASPLLVHPSHFRPVSV